MEKWISVLWPSFIVSAVATVGVFLVLDPTELQYIGGPDLSTLGYYSVTFLFLWTTTALTSLISHFFQRPPESFNDPEH
jgi:hypothetical protein